MADILEFPQSGQEEEPLTREELEEELTHLKAMLAVLDKKEPQNMQSEAYEVWGEQHEELEDQIDEILERLETL